MGLKDQKLFSERRLDAAKAAQQLPRKFLTHLRQCPCGGVGLGWDSSLFGLGLTPVSSLILSFLSRASVALHLQDSLHAAIFPSQPR